MRPSTISKKEKKISIRYIARQWKVNYYMGFPNTFFLKKIQIPWRVSSEEFLLKPYSTQDVLVRMLEEWQETLDNNFFVGAVLTYLSKSFGCLPHDSLIAKLSTCGFDNDSLCYIYSYLKKWQWCVRINDQKRGFEYIVSGVPQGYILGPILREIFFNDSFCCIAKASVIIFQLITPCQVLQAHLKNISLF